MCYATFCPSRWLRSDVFGDSEVISDRWEKGARGGGGEKNGVSPLWALLVSEIQKYFCVGDLQETP